MKKIKIVYIVSSLKRTGPINILYGIVRNLNKDLFDIYIITLSHEHSKSREKDFLQLGVKIKKLNLTRLRMQIYGRYKLFRIIEDIQPDIIHSHGFRPDYYSSQYDKCLTFTTIHNYPHKDYVMEYGKIMGTLMYKKQLKFMKKIKYPVACSKSISNELNMKFNVNTTYIQNGIDIKYFSNRLTDDEKVSLKKKLDIPVNKKVIISVGALIDRKNPFYLIDSFLNSNIKDKYCLVILGQGALADECKKRCELGIKMLGNVNNVREYLAISDIYISTSKAEGLPNSVLEAMSSGLPVLLSKIPPHEEILECNGSAGVLFDLNNNDLINKLNDLSKFNFKNMGLEAQKVIEDCFSDAGMSRNYEKMYLKSIDLI